MSVCFYYQFIMGDGFFSMVKSTVRSMMEPSLRERGAVMVPVGGVRSPFTIARYSLCTRRFFVISAIMLALTRCLEITVSPEVSRSRRLLQRKIKAFPDPGSTMPGIGQGVIVVFHGGMDRHSGRFVDHQDVFIFINNVQGKLYRWDFL